MSSAPCGPPGRALVAHWDGAAWTGRRLPPEPAWLPARADPVGGVWLAVNPAYGRPYVLNYRDGRWTRSTLPPAGGRTGFVDVVPRPGTTVLWALARRADGALLIYELA
ncbi:hypothetical protein OUY22_23545 [Nonomuraea sp. MCN248]|uniref:DUF2510 domain-containing protein n=1 Tax=Nonomuraea corallina TaxID=2989783 RepID=A0ABT4SGR6_9ACTN|nr:hypothetical protein [Nonomuraea corallina]MDA0636404.1 hypothetical protein [Nonomuraea corallina]